MSTISTLLRYDKATRNLMTRELVQDAMTVRAVSDLVALLEELASDVYECDESHLYREIAEWGRFRAIFMLLPEQLLFGPPPIEEKPLIRDHLEQLGLDHIPDLVSAIKCLCINFRAKRSASKKMGITDIYIKYPHVFHRMIQEQGGRCCYCGIKIEYGGNATLDHLWPFFLGDDPHDGSNWCLCCNDCNLGKGEYLIYSLSSVAANWIGPTADGKLQLSTRFAALSRDRACVQCGTRPVGAELSVRKRIESGCWILDNIVTICKMQCQSD